MLCPTRMGLPPRQSAGDPADDAGDLVGVIAHGQPGDLGWFDGEFFLVERPFVV
jgi:hypothetical protein